MSGHAGGAQGSLGLSGGSGVQPHEAARYAAAAVREGKRPDRSAPLVRVSACRAVLPQVMGWLHEPGIAPSDSEEVLADLVRASQTEDDGFAVASELKRLGWDAIDSGLVEILDDISCQAEKSRKHLVREWVRQFGVNADFALGAAVKFRTWKGAKRVDVRGVITEVMAEDARYLVFSQELGHIRSGLGTHGIYMDYEDVAAA